MVMILEDLIVMSNQSAQRIRDGVQSVYACVACKSSKDEHWKVVGNDEIIGCYIMK